MSKKLSSKLHSGVVHLAGRTPASHKLVEELVEVDRETHHALFNRGLYHNHLSHHLLALYDLGAPAKVLQAVWDAEMKMSLLKPLHMVQRSTLEDLTTDNWSDFLGQVNYYALYLDFFTAEIVTNGVGSTIEKYIFHPNANANGSEMLSRLFSGIIHSFIQLGYAVEFGSDAMIAQALAQAAVHKTFVPELFNDTRISRPEEPLSLFQILRQVYDSKIMHPVVPYDPDALLSTRIREAARDGRTEEIRLLSNRWFSIDETEDKMNTKVEELLWVTTLLLAGTGKPGRKPRLDFFLMHLLNATLFLPPVLKSIPTQESRVTLMNVFLRTILLYVTMRGRPRVDPQLMMSYTSNPAPPCIDSISGTSAMGDLNDRIRMNPWGQILRSVIHAPDPHTVKVIRTLYYASQHYGHTGIGEIVGIATTNGKKALKGIERVDGTVFIRAAGVVMNTLGWVSHGQTAGAWDYSGHGWDAAWDDED